MATKQATKKAPTAKKGKITGGARRAKQASDAVRRARKGHPAPASTLKTMTVPGLGKIGVSVPAEAAKTAPAAKAAPDTTQRDARIIELRKTGLGYIAIGKAVGLSDSGVMRILRRIAPKLTGRLEAKRTRAEKSRGPREDKSRESQGDKEAAPAEAPKVEEPKGPDAEQG